MALMENPSGAYTPTGAFYAWRGYGCIPFPPPSLIILNFTCNHPLTQQAHKVSSTYSCLNEAGSHPLDALMTVTNRKDGTILTTNGIDIPVAVDLPLRVLSNLPQAATPGLLVEIQDFRPAVVMLSMAIFKQAAQNLPGDASLSLANQSVSMAESP